MIVVINVIRTVVQKYSSKRRRTRMTQELTAVSFFTGAGGMDIGFERAGIRIVFANELMKEAAETYNANHTSGVI